MKQETHQNLLELQCAAANEIMLARFHAAAVRANEERDEALKALHEPHAMRHSNP